jgi:cob(I)alamin adenosyltransferase
VSIANKNGDTGTTGLMYNRRVSKCHPRVDACGTVDELNASIGLARASAPPGLVGERLLAIQQDLTWLMGELATVTEDLPRYVKDGYTLITPERTTKLDRWVRELESQQQTRVGGWATPGASPASAALDLARTTCRRAERRVCALHQTGEISNPEILVYLNRLSDVLWLLARHVEHLR